MHSFTSSNKFSIWFWIFSKLLVNCSLSISSIQVAIFDCKDLYIDKYSYFVLLNSLIGFKSFNDLSLIFFFSKFNSFILLFASTIIGWQEKTLEWSSLLNNLFLILCNSAIFSSISIVNRAYSSFSFWILEIITFISWIWSLGELVILSTNLFSDLVNLTSIVLNIVNVSIYGSSRKKVSNFFK